MEVAVRDRDEPVSTGKILCPLPSRVYAGARRPLQTTRLLLPVAAMSRPHFSLGTLLLAVLSAGVAFAALKSPSDTWASALFTTAVAVLLVATLGAVHRRERRPGLLARVRPVRVGLPHPEPRAGDGPTVGDDRAAGRPLRPGVWEWARRGNRLGRLLARRAAHRQRVGRRHGAGLGRLDGQVAGSPRIRRPGGLPAGRPRAPGPADRLRRRLGVAPPPRDTRSAALVAARRRWLDPGFHLRGPDRDGPGCVLRRYHKPILGAPDGTSPER